jgi:arabinofuranan 3-O-arabinosyltransferase
MSRTRRISAACAVVALLALAFAREGEQRDRIALVTLVAIASATALGWAQLLGVRRPRTRGRDRVENRDSRQWLIAAIAVVLMAGLAVQTWFRIGTTIATGDIKPPEGLAWLGRLFEPWAWTGSNLGEPSQLPLALPWAAVLGMVHALGGDPELAQRIWYTTLFIGAGLSAFGLIAALRMGPGAALVGAAVYLFNPYVVSVVNIYPEYIAALGLLAAVPAAILAAGFRQLSVPMGAALVALSAPIFGYVGFNPPLVGMVLGVTLATPVLSGWLGGRTAAMRSLLTLSLATPLLLAASAYWIVPAILHLQVVASDQLASLSNWSWTESRATLGNALWLNTHWGWNFPEYFPFGAAYDAFPLSVVRYILPAIAFGTLALPLGHDSHGQRLQRDRALRLAVVAATGASIIILLSTGTNPPGNVAFDVLYRLPLGWLLREPGRFLMVVALAYAVLVAVGVDVSNNHWSTIDFKRLQRAVADALNSHRSMIDLNGLRRGLGPAARASVPLVALATVACVGFPIYTGAVVPDSRPILPSAHVKVPGYWNEMARFVDAQPMHGSLLIMPPDDFYQMPYSWGYYGTDDFIVDLFQRPVLVPNSQGYSPASAQVVRAVSLTGQSILDRDWRQTEALVTALDTPLILVRRDIETPYYGRAILSPNDLAEALSTAPSFTLVRTIGSLELFALRSAITESGRLSDFVTINSLTPDLRILSLLPSNAALVSGEAIVAIPSIVQAPPLELWQQSGNDLVWQPPGQLASRYRIADLGSKTVVALDQPGTYMAGLSQARIFYAPNVVNSPISVSVTGRAAISNGDFAAGLWGPVGDCHDVLATQARPGLGASVIADGAPGGLPALRLSAQLDSACESQSLDWRGGALMLSLMVHTGRGNAPRICLWEVGPERCASIPSVPEGSGWSAYRASVTPDSKTTAVDIFLYADGEGTDTVSEYANVRVIEVPALPSLALLVNPEEQPASSLQLVVLHNSFSTRWASTEGKHVIVDGMLNGWLVPPGSQPFVISYLPAGAFRTAQSLSVVAVLITLLIPVGLMIWRLAHGYLGRSSTKQSPAATRRPK